MALQYVLYVFLISIIPASSSLENNITRLLMTDNESSEVGFHSGILLSAHLHPKGMAVFLQVTVWSLRDCERDKMGEDINTAGDGLHLSTVHRVLLISWPNCAPIRLQKKKDQLLHLKYPIFLFFSPLFPCSAWEYSALGFTNCSWTKT